MFFNLFANILTAPLKIATATVKTAVKVTGDVVTGDLDKAVEDFSAGGQEAKQAIDDIVDS